MIVVKIYEVQVENVAEAFDAINEAGENADRPAEEGGFMLQMLAIEDDDSTAFLDYVEEYRRTFSG